MGIFVSLYALISNDKDGRKGPKTCFTKKKKKNLRDYNTKSDGVFLHWDIIQSHIPVWLFILHYYFFCNRYSNADCIFFFGGGGRRNGMRIIVHSSIGVPRIFFLQGGVLALKQSRWVGGWVGGGDPTPFSFLPQNLMVNFDKVR